MLNDQLKKLKLLVDNPINVLLSFTPTCSDRQQTLMGFFSQSDCKKRMFIDSDQEYIDTLAVYLAWRLISNSYSTIVVIDKMANHVPLRKTLKRVINHFNDGFPNRESLLQIDNKTELALFNSSVILFRSKKSCVLRGLTASLIILNNVDDDELLDNAAVSILGGGSVISITKADEE